MSVIITEFRFMQIHTNVVDVRTKRVYYFDNFQENERPSVERLCDCFVFPIGNPEIKMNETDYYCMSRTFLTQMDPLTSLI